jgi:transcription termination factor Rho
MNIIELENKPLAELRQMAKEFGVQNANRLKKEALILKIRKADAEKEGLEVRGGILEIMNEGIGFLRSERYQIGEGDVYVSQAQLRRYELRSGDLIIGNVRPPRESERHYGLLKVESVNGLDPDEARNRPVFETLTPIFPDKRFNLETKGDILSTRVINLIVPIGMGQRGLIVSPPKAGKTTILKDIANAISTQYPDVHLMVALIGERPEEVTDMDRSVDAEVIASTFDEPVTAHVRTAEIALDRAKRLVETGRNVVILMDSITRLARAYNLWSILPGVRFLVVWILRLCIPQRDSLVPPGILKAAVHSRSSPPAWWIPVPAWMMSCMKSSRAPVTWNCTCLENYRNGAYSRQWTWSVLPPDVKTCCSDRISFNVSG